MRPHRPIWRRHYRPDVFPGLWEDIEKLVNEGRLIAPREVLEELRGVDDEILEWAKGHGKMFLALDDDQLREVTTILEDFPRLIDPNKETPDADPFLIALASTTGWTVVTSEKSRTNPDARPKVPDVCKSRDVECISLIEFFREQEWKYVQVDSAKA